MNTLSLGQIVCSKAGRDKNKHFVIVGFPAEQADCVYLADGKTRRIENPKLKKIRHISRSNHIDESILFRLQNALVIENEDLVKTLQAFSSAERI